MGHATTHAPSASTPPTEHARATHVTSTRSP